MYLRVLMLAGLISTPTYGSIVQLTFSGVWGNNLGLIHTGDSFSGTARWDTTTVGSQVANFAPLTSLSLTLPAGDGLSVPGGTILFEGAHWTGSVFDFIQVNETSTVDHNTYALEFATFSGPTASNVTLGGTTIQSSSSQASLATLPEPNTYALLVAGLLIIVWQQRSKQYPIRATGPTRS
jgi:hypothetical protein